MRKPIRITAIRHTTVTAPLAAPIRHANGAHWGRFVRTIIEVETNAGVTGLGEMGDGGESAELAFRALEYCYAGDAHYQHLVDDIIAGGKMRYENGAVRVPEGPGLGVTIDRNKLQTYADLYRQLGGYAYDRDPSRPGWFAQVPNRNWAE